MRSRLSFLSLLRTTDDEPLATNRRCPRSKVAARNFDNFAAQNALKVHSYRPTARN
jgi:hypothetical protein